MRASADPIEDIGHGVRIERRYVDGELTHIHYWHGDCEGGVAVKPAWADGWDVLSVKPLTLAPSLLCRVCQHHGFIRDGRWVPA
jgi:hypothetical protein